jgi:cytochrome bd-type quinol oxidase subunit 2
MLKYDLLVYLGIIPVMGALAVGAIALKGTPTDADIETRKVRLASGVLVALFSMFIFCTILYFADANGAGKEIFDKAFTAILTLVGTIIGYIFGSTRK